MKKDGYTLIESLQIVGVVAVCLVILTVLIGGWGQIAVKKFGGSMTVNIEPNLNVVNCTWKENQLWILTRVRSTQETQVPQTYKFNEHSTLGILQGEVIIKEH